MELEGKVALITGGTSGIGMATAELFLKKGAHTIICGRNGEKGKNAEAALKKLCSSNTVLFHKCDVSSEKEVQSLFQLIDDKFSALDFAINGAAISKSGKMITEFTESDFNEIMNINVKGVFLCVREELQAMLKRKGGVIVNIASVMGLRANNSKNALYTATKHAIIGFTKEAALEYATLGIRVNAVLPAYTETEIIKHHLEDPEKRKRIENMHPIKRLIQPEEVADAILFLCSKQATALTGVLLPVDGGCMAN